MPDKILTGSAEFWPDHAMDTDYIIFREQDEVFRHERDHTAKVCHFCYRAGLTKEEYFDWHARENNWYLNFAPLITAGFLRHMGIDIFGVDKEAVYAIFRKVFDLVYRNVSPERWNKYAYRVYIYCCFVRNGALKLSRKQIETALKFKQRKAVDETAVKSLYDFFTK